MTKARKFEIRVYIIIFVLGLLYLSYHLTFMFGGMHERENAECVTPYVLSQWHKGMELSDTIVNNLISDYNETLLKADEEIEYWKRNYLWLKQKQDAVLLEKGE